MIIGGGRPPIITLLTDFGWGDGYVGSMKGVILSLSPEARLVDLSHDVPAQDIMAGAMLLKAVWRFFPAGTIHLAVVDPGVGSRRRALAASCGAQFWVGPDNGLFSFIFGEQNPDSIVCLKNPRYFLAEVSATFHGRDIFAPVAAHLSLGVELGELGPELKDPVRLEMPEPRFEEAGVVGQIVWRDHFGNLISNIPWGALQAWLRGRRAWVRIGGQGIRDVVTAYSEVPSGGLLALGGSHGYLEIACREGSAARVLEVEVGARVAVEV